MTGESDSEGATVWQLPDPRELDPDHESLTLGEILRTLTAWAEANGGLEGPTLEVARDKSLEGALRVSMMHAANLVDVLSDYIHGNYLPGDGNGQPRDEAVIRWWSYEVR